jgi:glucan endo-1,3-alpha-glucosidase
MVSSSPSFDKEESNKPTDQFEWWSNDTVRFMFDYADKVKDFKLFFSFDHGKKVLTGDPMQYADYFMSYIIRDSYFTFKDPNTGKVKPLLSTFGGESVPDSDWAKFKNKVGPVLIVPGFYEATPSANFFNNRGSLDGVFNWNSWQPSNAGKVRVSSEQDSIYQSATTKSQRRVFMMGISPVQFKHLSEKDNWYRRGEDNLEYRLGQALELQPDIIQLQSWNDAGEVCTSFTYMVRAQTLTSCRVTTWATSGPSRSTPAQSS